MTRLDDCDIIGGLGLGNVVDRDLLCVVLASTEASLVKQLTAEPHRFRESTVRSCVAAGCLTASQVLSRLKSTAAKCKKCGRNDLEPITVIGCGMSVCESCIKAAVDDAIESGKCKSILDAGEDGGVMCPVAGCDAKLCGRDVEAACELGCTITDGVLLGRFERALFSLFRTLAPSPCRRKASLQHRPRKGHGGADETVCRGKKGT